MMNFRVIKDNLATILNAAAAANNYRVVDHQLQISSVKEVLGAKRRVQVYWSGSDFPKNKSPLTGPVQSEVRYTIDLTLAAAATGDLTAMTDENATPTERATAIDAFQDSSAIADEQMDEFFEVIYQTLMDGVNVDIGTSAPFFVSSRWIPSVNKEKPIPVGEYIYLTASAEFTCQIEEQIVGDTSGINAVSPVNDITNDIDGDDIEKTGALVG